MTTKFNSDRNPAIQVQIDAQIDKFASDPDCGRFTARQVADAVAATNPKLDTRHLEKLASRRLVERFDPAVRVREAYPNDPIRQAEALAHHAGLLQAEMNEATITKK